MKTFHAKNGIDDIYSPLEKTYEMNTNCYQTNIFLLTLGRDFNTDQIFQLVASNSDINRRLHTFGITKTANETLLSKCAMMGLGNFYFIKEMS